MIIRMEKFRMVFHFQLNVSIESDIALNGAGVITYLAYLGLTYFDSGGEEKNYR
jgi:hypothetical protein